MAVGCHLKYQSSEVAPIQSGTDVSATDTQHRSGCPTAVPGRQDRAFQTEHAAHSYARDGQTIGLGTHYVIPGIERQARKKLETESRKAAWAAASLARRGDQGRQQDHAGGWSAARPPPLPPPARKAAGRSYSGFHSRIFCGQDPDRT